jgi:signal peptidase I
MAETLLGIHRDVVCDNCSRRFSFGTDTFAAASRAVCPNCGFVVSDLESLPDAGADRVLIDRTAFSIREPRRWEIAAFQRPSQADMLAIKRIVGLPGESIEIRHGDVYADGMIQRKNLSQQRALAILVHDADFSPKTMPRWRPERSDSRWNTAAGSFLQAVDLDNRAVDWLVYHHDRELPVTDICNYNPSQPRRAEDVHQVADLMLSFRLSGLSGRGTFYIRIGDGRDGVEVQLQCDKQRDNSQSSIRCATVCLQAVSGESVAAYTACKQAVAHFSSIPILDNERLIEVSLFDRQFLLAVDGQTLATLPIDRLELPESLPACPLAIGAQGINATVSHLQIYRDVYYTDPLEARGRSRSTRPVRLGTDEYYVLGDNSPVSEDSRTWPEPAAVDAKFLIGKPLAAISSITVSLGGTWHFQVPNPIEIRYIR